MDMTEPYAHIKDMIDDLKAKINELCKEIERKNTVREELVKINFKLERALERQIKADTEPEKQPSALDDWGEDEDLKP